MKKTALTIVAALAFGLAAQTADGPVNQAAPRRPPPGAGMRQLARMGGYVVQPNTMKGAFLILDAQSRVPSEKASGAVAKKINFLIQFNVQTKKGEAPTIRTADRALSDSGANAAVFLVDSDELPALLVAPERKWAFVNVRPLAADKPDQERLEFRTRSELWRAFAMVLGAGDTESTACVLNPCVSLADLDAARSGMISMEPLGTIQKHAKKIGIEPYRRVRYRQACREGWAPAPTNDFQQAIWDKVNAEKERGPTNPIKIEPPKK